MGMPWISPERSALQAFGIQGISWTSSVFQEALP